MDGNKRGLVTDVVKRKRSLAFAVRKDKTRWMSELRPLFHFHFHSNQEYVFSAKMTSSNTTSTIITTLNNKNFTENGTEYLGKYKGNFTGSQFNIYGVGYNPLNAKEK